ncbi:MAG TPA: LuxR C-terminal-related transcriptional regulator [Candidatus Limnocylindria bacterium]|nr:LuxR C-terminal-related transcriptional regulator [Candidatus Limnocylindria bacterium]
MKVNSTARWPERLEQVATLLRAEGAAILALQNGDVRTLFSCRIDDELAWRLVLGDDAVDRAVTDRGAFATAIPAERWGDAVAYALLAPITSTAGERGILCAMRHSVPFDAVEVVAGEAAARLLSMAFSDSQAVAIAERDTAVALPPAERPPLRVAIIESHPATRIGLETILERAGVTVSVSCSTLAEALSRTSGTRCDVALMGTVADATAADAVHRLRAKARLEVIVIADERRGTDAHAALRAGAAGQIARDAAPVRIVAALHAAAAGLAALDTAALDALLRSPRGSAASAPSSDPLRETAAEPFQRRASDRLPGHEDDGDAERTDVRDNERRTDQAERTTQRTDRATDRSADRGSDRGADRASERAADGTAAERPERPAGALSPREMELLRYLAEGYTNKEIARVMVLAEDTVKKGVQSLIAKLGAADRTHAVVLALRSGLID